MYVHYGIVLLIYLSFGGSYAYIASDISLSDAVKEGVSALDGVSAFGWVCFTVFWVASIIYFWRSFVSGLMSAGSGIKFVFTGMKVDPSWETVFNTPEWHKPKGNNNEEATNATDLNIQVTSDPNQLGTQSTDALVT